MLGGKANKNFQDPFLFRLGRRFNYFSVPFASKKNLQQFNYTSLMTIPNFEGTLKT